ncbi:coiled-coil domain-containing protein R3HCC1L isoform X2 [Pseudomyrmex gracilis]|nr:coiled-coil domain-containing protein R3HCC1L isoform X2 [Pseudomyrmex gracilis]
MGVEGRRSPSSSPEYKPTQRQAKSTPSVEIYRPPAARRAANNCSQTSGTQIQTQQSTTDSPSVKNVRQRRPDRAVYVPRHRRSLEIEEKKPQNSKAPLATPISALNEDSNTNNNSKLQDVCCAQRNIGDSSSSSQLSDGLNVEIEDSRENLKNIASSDSEITFDAQSNAKPIEKENAPTSVKEKETSSDHNENSADISLEPFVESKEQLKSTQETAKENQSAENLNCSDITDCESKADEQDQTSNVLVISDVTKNQSNQFDQVSPVHAIPPEKKAKKIERQKSKPVPPPSPPIKINRDECDWDSLFDDNGDCLDPTLIDELTSAVGEVVIEQPKNDYKAYSKQVEVSSDEFAHVVEIYNFPSEFKTSDLAAVFSSFKNGGFELKWVDDTHCLGVFSSPLVAAEVLASNHPFVKTRPLSQATALSKTKARRSAEFLQPYRNRPETCSALAKRLVTGALGVRLATASQEREREKNILREAKEKKRLANKQREDAWEGIIPTK